MWWQVVVTKSVLGCARTTECLEAGLIALHTNRTMPKLLMLPAAAEVCCVCRIWPLTPATDTSMRNMMAQQARHTSSSDALRMLMRKWHVDTLPPLLPG